MGFLQQNPLRNNERVLPKLQWISPDAWFEALPQGLHSPASGTCPLGGGAGAPPALAAHAGWCMIASFLESISQGREIVKCIGMKHTGIVVITTAIQGCPCP